MQTFSSVFGLEGVAIFFVLIESLGKEGVSEDDLLGWGRNISAHLSFYFSQDNADHYHDPSLVNGLIW